MPAVPDTSDDKQRCINPDCNGVAVVDPGSHPSHGTYEWWTRRKRLCPKCGWKFQTSEGVIPGTIEIPEIPPEPEPLEPLKPDPQKCFAFDCDLSQ